MTSRITTLLPAARMTALMLFACSGVLAANPKLPTDDIPAKIAAVKDKFEGSDYVVVLDATDITVADDGMGTAVNTRVVKILTEGGAKSQCRQVWDYDPATNVLNVERVRVHRADGRVDDVDTKSIVSQPAPQWGIFWGSLQIIAGVPALAVGDSIEMTHVKKGFNTAYLADAPTASAIGSTDGPSLKPPMPGHWYDKVIWDEGVPIIEKRYVVRISRDKPLQYEIVNGSLTTSVRFDGPTTIYTFSSKNTPPFRGEANMVSGSDVRCKLVLATLGDWHEKARWFHQENEKSFEVDDAIKDKVKEVIADAKDDEDKIALLNHWVAENVRYVGTCRGAHEGYTTHPVIETFHDRGGVCKDKAGLLVAMLREAGFDSHIVMTEAGSRVEQTPADQFNHAVTCIRNKDGSFRLLDPTWLPKSREMWSSAEQLQAVVYGTPEGEAGLQLSPYSPPIDNATDWLVKSAINKDGNLKTNFAVTTLGAPETALRRAMSGLRPQDRAGRLEESLRILSPNTLLGSFELTDPVDFSQAAQIRMEATAASYALGAGGRRFFKLPAMTGVLMDLLISDLRDSAGSEPKDRKHPLRIRSTRRLACRESIELPSDWLPITVPEKVSLDSPAAMMKFDIRTEAGRIEYSCELDLKKHIVPVEEYEGYKKAIDALKKLGTDWVACGREESRASR